MSIVRWEPFAEMDSLFNRLVPTLFNRWPSRLLSSSGGTLEWAPSADISETDKEYLIKAALPAVKKEDVKVTVDEGVITIKGERKQEKEEKNEKFHRTETVYGSFERSFALPDTVNADGITCESKDGVLTVHMPKIEAKKAAPKQINVQ
jgi:HSP20 family protein